MRNITIILAFLALAIIDAQEDVKVTKNLPLRRCSSDGKCHTSETPQALLETGAGTRNELLTVGPSDSDINNISNTNTVAANSSMYKHDMEDETQPEQATKKLTVVENISNLDDLNRKCTPEGKCDVDENPTEESTKEEKEATQPNSQKTTPRDVQIHTKIIKITKPIVKVDNTNKATADLPKTKGLSSTQAANTAAAPSSMKENTEVLMTPEDAKSKYKNKYKKGTKVRIMYDGQYQNAIIESIVRKDSKKDARSEYKVRLSDNQDELIVQESSIRAFSSSFHAGVLGRGNGKSKESHTIFLFVLFVILCGLVICFINMRTRKETYEYTTAPKMQQQFSL